MSDYTDIWSPGDEDGRGALSGEQLLAYLEDRLPDAERRAIEELLSTEGMESDALEGLQALSAEDTRAMKRQLNAALQKTLYKKRRNRRGIGEQRWTWIAIVVILVLAVLCYALMYLMKHPLR